MLITGVRDATTMIMRHVVLRSKLCGLIVHRYAPFEQNEYVEIPTRIVVLSLSLALSPLFQKQKKKEKTRLVIYDWARGVLR